MPKLTPAPTVEAAFVEQRAAIKALLTQATRDEIATRYQASLRLLLLKRNPEKYGNQALERVAEELGLGPATLHRYSGVAEAWPGHDIHDLLARTGGSASFAWSHLVLLTGAPSVAVRQELTDACIREGWSTRELRDRLEALTPQAPSEQSLDDCRSLRAILQDATGRAIQATREMAALGETLEEHWDEDWADDPLLDEAIATLESLLEAVDAARAALRRVRGVSETRLKVAAAVPTGDTGSRR